MKQNLFRSILLLSVLAGTISVAEAAVTVRLIYGESWSRAGRAVRNTLNSAAFKAIAAEKGYVVDCQDESGKQVAAGNLGTLKLPAIFLVNDAGNCFSVWENVPFDATPERIDALITEHAEQTASYTAAANGFATVDDCGRFLENMEPLVGGSLSRVVSKGYYADVFERLKALDPEDKTGWRLRYTMGDGLSYVNTANGYREKGDFEAGEAYVKDLEAKPSDHLTTEQKQSFSMARFALYRTDGEKTDEMNKLLKAVVNADETTFWGTGALGWLKMRGVTPPLSLYWGWHETDFSTKVISKTITYGVDVALARPGDYTVTFKRDASSESEPTFFMLLLRAKDGSVIQQVTDPVVTNDMTVFSFTIDAANANRTGRLYVYGSNASTAPSSGTITVARRVRKARQEGLAGQNYSYSRGDNATDFLREKKISEATFSAICAREGGAAFLTRFFKDKAWLADFAGSGTCGNWNGALKVLDTLVWNDDGFISTEMGRKMATAFALNHPNYTEEKAVRLMALYRSWVRSGRIIDYAWDYDCYKWREALAFGQCDELTDEDFIYIQDFTNLDAPRYPPLTGHVAYRLFNCFGSSVHGAEYYQPWRHRLTMEETRHRVGGVCGSVSKFASHQAIAHGIRCFTAGQPAHCAYLVWDYDRETWSIGFNVTAHTAPHFQATTYGLQALLEAERYFAHPNRMRAEDMMWQGRNRESLAFAPGNWQAANLWKNSLSTEADWDQFGGAILRSFKDAPYTGWVLYRSYIDHLVRTGASEEKLLDAAKQGVRFFAENTAASPEKPYLDEFFLSPLSTVFSGRRDAFAALIAEALEAYSDSPSFYDQTVSWGLNKLLGAGEPASAQQTFMDALLKSVKSSSSEGAFGSMVLRASEVADIEIFHKVYAAIERNNPEFLRTSSVKYPGEMNGGELLSSNGVLTVSSAWGFYNKPLYYMSALTADKFTDQQFAFHTKNESAPWAKVTLPGECGLTAIQVVNRRSAWNNTMRQVPIRIHTSLDGENWTTVYESSDNLAIWTVTFTEPVKAKYVKVDRTPGARSDCYHLDKILIYGTKHYGVTEAPTDAEGGEEPIQ